MSTSKRKKLPVGVETQVLTESRRRCCLCFHLGEDLDVKRGQIAHIDHKRSNNNESNLAFLCFDHHDDYDSKNSQSKGFTTGELRHAKKTLYETLQSQPKTERVQLRVTIEADFDKLHPDERRLLVDKVLDFTNVKGEVRILNIERGSVRLTLELDIDDAANICKAFNSGQLSPIGVIDVRSERMESGDITFCEGYQNYSHGISNQQAVDVILHSDSMLLFDGAHQVSKDTAKFGFYLKRITNKYSILIVVGMASQIIAAFPINHSYIEVHSGANPLNVLKMLLDRFGMELNLDEKRTLLRLDESIRLPFNVTSDEEFIRYCERIMEKGGERYELVFVMEKRAIISPIVHIQLMFAVSKERYYPSLHDIGIKFQQGKLGRHMKCIKI